MEKDNLESLRKQAIELSLGIVSLGIYLLLGIYAGYQAAEFNSFFPKSYLTLFLAVFVLFIISFYSYKLSFYLLFHKPYEKYNMLKGLVTLCDVEEVHVTNFNAYAFKYEGYYFYIFYAHRKKSRNEIWIIIHHEVKTPHTYEILMDYFYEKEIGKFVYITEKLFIFMIPFNYIRDNLNLFIKEFVYVGKRFQLEAISEKEFKEIMSSLKASTY